MKLSDKEKLQREKVWKELFKRNGNGWWFFVGTPPSRYITTWIEQFRKAEWGADD